ncbi:MAG: serine/threonine-protein kinase, partial [Planctomycetota bacterium]
MSEEPHDNSQTAPTMDPGKGAADSRDPDSGPGDTLGPYKILSEIGRGGMGVVYKAVQPELKRTVALKVLIAGEDASDEAIARFHREAESVAKLGHHPHIVPVYDIGRSGNLHYFAMHFVEGRPLDRWIDEGDVTPRKAASITKKVAGALHHAHENGVLHRDIKPANILMSKEGEPQITDFGLAKDVESESKMTRSGVTLGTPHYMAPEQADGRVDEIDERSDVYALGATLYEMLAYQPPFEGTRAVEVIQKVLLIDPVSPRKRNAAVDRDLETICLTCLAKEPHRRYGSAKALGEDVGRYLEGHPILARPVSTLTKLWKKVRRNRLASAALALLAFVILVGGAVGIYSWSRWLAREEEMGQQLQTTTYDRDRAESLLEKNRAVGRVLYAGHVKLGEAHRLLKARFLDADDSGEGKQEALKEHLTTLETFQENAPKDTSSQATALAIKGYFLWLGGYGDRAMAAFEEARRQEPDVAWGYLFEAMVWLSSYMRSVRLPPLLMDISGIRFGAWPPESPDMIRARKRIMKLLEGLQKRGLLCGAAEEDFQIFLSGLQ